jgi:hypothetical protein
MEAAALCVAVGGVCGSMQDGEREGKREHRERESIERGGQHVRR